MKVPKAHELFRRMSSAEVAAVVAAACEDDELPEKIAGGVLTYQQIPLKRFSKLPEDTRLAYVRRTLRDRRASDLCLYVLSAALTRRQAALISSFLEALKLPHEGPSLTNEGAIPAPSAKALRSAVDALLASHESRDVALYLHAFASQPDVDWPVLEKLLESDARLAFEDRSAT
ncbi:MAG TPA: hypothetical protein VKS23_00600 [Thermoanaerobaculia bacterium]|jgi:hypothetical protein|nr:hypothetical protein [Thermoanaerobaculia bacterium]